MDCHELSSNVQATEPKKAAPKGRKGRRAAVTEAEAADVHAEEIEIIDDEEEGADSAASQVQPPYWHMLAHAVTCLRLQMQYIPLIHCSVWGREHETCACQGGRFGTTSKLRPSTRSLIRGRQRPDQAAGCRRK